MSSNPLNDLSKVYLDQVANVKKAENEADIQRWEEIGGPTPTNYKPTGSSAKIRTESVSRSDWRNDIFEAGDPDATQTPGFKNSKDVKKKVTEKSVNNTVVINPKLNEAIKEIGGELIEVEEVVSEAVKGEDAEMRKAAAQERKKGIGKLKSKKAGESYAKWAVAKHPASIDEDDQTRKQQLQRKQLMIDRQKLQLRRKALGQKKKEGETETDAQANIIANEGVMTILRGKKKEKKAEKAMDAGARAKRMLARKVHAHYVSGSEDNVPDDIRDHYEVNERTLSSYIPSDRQGEARRANLDYVKAQLKKKEDESTKNRGDLSKRDAGKMAKERLRTKKISSLGEASVALDANKKIKNQEQRKKDEKEYARLMAILAHQKDLKKRGLGEEAEKVDESKGHKYDDSFIEGETGSKTSRRNLTRAMSSTKIGMGKGAKGKAEDSVKRRERHQTDRGVKTKGTKAGHSGSAYPKMSKTLDDTYPHKKEARLKQKLADRKAGRKHVDDTHHSLKQKTVGEKLPKAKVNEAKVDQGRSDYGKASIRNYRRSGPGHGEPAMFDPENKRGKLIDKRREEHKARRGVKGAKVPAYKVSEGTDKALEYVKKQIAAKYGKDSYVSKDNPRKPQSSSDKAKARAHQAKVDAENAAERAKDPSQGRYPKG